MNVCNTGILSNYIIEEKGQDICIVYRIDMNSVRKQSIYQSLLNYVLLLGSIWAQLHAVMRQYYDGVLRPRTRKNI